MDLVALTNANRIRSMSDEELANKLTECTYISGYFCPSWSGPYRNAFLTKQDAVDEWLIWLRQPADEDK